MKSVANVLRALLPSSKPMPTHSPKKRQTRQLHFEPLEERQMLSISPADFDAIKAAYPDLNLTAMTDYNVIEIGGNDVNNVSSFAFSEDGIKAAISRAGQTPENDLIVVRTTTTQKAITLSGEELGININVGQYGSVAVVSLGAEKLTIDADQQSRVFSIGANSEVALAGLTITGGNVDGHGGGIFNSGSKLTITDSNISRNSATDDWSFGGGIYNHGELTITDSSIFDNTAIVGGGIFHGGNGELTVTNSTITDNLASWGGGIYNSGGITPLILDTMTRGILTGNAYPTIYKLDITESKPLSILLDGYAQGNNVRLYAQYGYPPTLSDYTFISEGGAASKQSITIPKAITGPLYIMVVGEYVPTPSGYTLIASLEDMIVDSVTLTQFGGNEPMSVMVSGAGFVAMPELPTLTLIAQNGTRYPTVQPSTLNSSTSIQAAFSGTIPAGTYKLEVKNGNGMTVVVEDAVTVADKTIAARLEANVILPSSLGNRDAGFATLYVEYTNTGTVAMMAPLLTLRATMDGKEGARMTLDANRLAAGMNTSTVPVGFSTSVQIYAEGTQSGVLLPGETIRVPVYWAGWNTLLPEDGQLDFILEVVDANNTKPLDFAELKTALKPEGYIDAAWEVVWPRLQSLMGSTWGSYVKMLGDIAGSLVQTGSKQSYNVNDLFASAVQWANDELSPFGRLVASTDLAAGALSFNRTFIGTEISSRFFEGDLGYGWDHNWNWKLETKSNGDCVLKGPFGVERLFQSDVRQPGDFVSQAGDGVSLRFSGGIYTFTESNGMVLAFNSQGRLEKITDLNGNTVTVTSSNGKLMKLADEYGNSLTFAYHANGKIESITDNLGNATTYTYDATGKNLITVTNALDLSVEYAYAADHTLSTITYADGNIQRFEYDHGVLYKISIDGLTSTSYIGGQTAKDFLKYDVYEGTTLVQTIWYNANGQIAKATDSDGRMVIYEYDSSGRVVKITDETGSFTSMEYDLWGNLIYSRNTNGEELRFKYDVSGNLLTLTDSNGNLTTFRYDDRGNLTSIERADGTSSGLTYYENGMVSIATNRRGDTYTYVYDTEGRILENAPSTAIDAGLKPIRYEYDDRGNVTKITGEHDEVTTMTYDENDLLTRIDYPSGKWIEYTYDEFGRQTSIKSGSDYHVEYTYNTFGLLESIRDVLRDEIVTQYEYDAQGRLSKETQGNGTYTIYEYNSLGFLTAKTDYDKNDVILSRFDYTYDAKGLVHTMTTLDGTWSYGYDSIGQLTSAIFVSINAEIENQSYVYVYDGCSEPLRTFIIVAALVAAKTCWTKCLEKNSAAPVSRTIMLLTIRSSLVTSSAGLISFARRSN